MVGIVGQKTEARLLRIWDISPKRLCRNHLLGEHRELHAIWNILTKGRKGYSSHPETLRWQGKLGVLYLKHSEIVQEMKRRGYRHKSALSPRLKSGFSKQVKLIDSHRKQIKILRQKCCECDV